MELAAKMLANPYRIAETQMNLWWDYSALWQSSMLQADGQASAPVAEPAKATSAFATTTGSSISCSTIIKQSYLITARWLHTASPASRV